MHQLISVPFHQDNLVLINHNDEPFVAIKPIVVQMGLIWAAQYVKIMEKFESTVSIIETVGEDGKLREMICLPLKKLPAWLYSISPNKVKPEIKDKIIQYQDECDDVLWQYWTKGFVDNLRNSRNGNQQVQLGNYRLKLADMLLNETHATKRAMIYEQLNAVSNALGFNTPTMEELGSNNKFADLLDSFWEYYQDNHETINQSNDHNFIAINMTMVLPVFSKYMGKDISRSLLRSALMLSKSPQYIEQKSIRSKRQETIRCFVFKA